MAKVTSKLQVSIPKRIAEEVGIAPGDEIEFLVAGGGIRVVKAGRRSGMPDRAERLALFDRATARQRGRRKAPGRAAESTRGWTRDSLYDRGRPR